MGIPPYMVKGDYLFGRTIGIVDDENGKPLWIISGIWKTNLSNQTQAGDNSTIFDASFEMIKTDGTSKHTHTLTDFDQQMLQIKITLLYLMAQELSVCPKHPSLKSL